MFSVISKKLRQKKYIHTPQELMSFLKNDTLFSLTKTTCMWTAWTAFTMLGAHTLSSKISTCAVLGNLTPQNILHFLRSCADTPTQFTWFASSGITWSKRRICNTNFMSLRSSLGDRFISWTTNKLGRSTKRSKGGVECSQIFQMWLLFHQSKNAAKTGVRLLWRQQSWNWTRHLFRNGWKNITKSGLNSRPNLNPTSPRFREFCLSSYKNHKRKRNFRERQAIREQRIWLVKAVGRWSRV